MINFLLRIQRAANQFSMVDFAVFKIYLFSIGILFGLYFFSFFAQWLNTIWIVAIASCIFTLVRLVQLFLKS